MDHFKSRSVMNFKFGFLDNLLIDFEIMGASTYIPMFFKLSMMESFLPSL